jgi:hypothetical protein
MVASSLKRIRFKQLEIPGGVPNGLRALNRSLRGWLYDLSPCATIESGKPLEALEDALHKDSRYFENWIKRHLLDNPHRCLVTVKPDGEHQKRQTDAIARYATQVTASLDKKGVKLLQDQNQRFLQFEMEGDTPEALATIPRLHLEDLPSTIRPNTHQTMQCAGQPLYIRPQFCNQIVYADFAFNVEDLSERELILLPLYTRLLQTTGLGDLTYAQVATRLKHLTGDFNVYTEMGSSCNERDVLMLMCRVKTLREDFEPAMQFVQELLTGANVGDLKQLKLVLNNYKTDFADSVTYSAHSFASLCAASVFSPIQWEGEQLSGLHQWFFLESIEEKDLPSIAQELERLQRKLSNRRRLLLHLSCDEALVQEFVPVYEAFTEAFSDQGVVQPVPRSYKEVSKGTIHEVQLYRLPATVSYAAWAMRTEKRGTVLQAAQILLANILTGNDLWEVIRGQGGAYGVAANADVMEEICVFSTYRDPRIAGTYRDFIKILNKYAQIDIDPGHIENALIATIGSELKPLSPSQDSILAFRRLFYHISDEFRAMRRQHLLQLDSKQLNEGAKALLRSAKEEDSYVVLSGAQLLEAEKEKHPILDRPSIRLPL